MGDGTAWIWNIADFCFPEAIQIVDRFHAQGLSTSSGVLETGCKHAIGTRLKRAGMHWSLKGANTIIALRCCRLSGRFEDFWERRASRAA